MRGMIGVLVILGSEASAVSGCKYLFHGYLLWRNLDMIFSSFRSLILNAERDSSRPPSGSQIAFFNSFLKSPYHKVPPHPLPPLCPLALFTVALPLAKPTPRPLVPLDLNIGAFLCPVPRQRRLDSNTSHSTLPPEPIGNHCDNDLTHLNISGTMKNRT